jgi:ribose transport system substrate-binding protein
MKTHRSGRRTAAGIAGAAVTALAVAACGSSASSSPSAAAHNTSQADAIVRQAEAPLAAWTAPGPAVNAASVAGKQIAYIPDAPDIPYTEAVYAGFQQAASIVGVKSLFLTNDSTPSGWEQNISEAVSEHVAAIVLQGIPSGLISQGIKQANAAHIPVIETSDEDVSFPLASGVAAQVQYPVLQVGKIMAAYAISQSKGDVNAAVITSSDTSAATPLLKGIKQEFSAGCGSSCSYTVSDVPVADWATKIPQLVQSLLQSHPNLNWIIPLYDSEMPYIVPAITTAQDTSKVHVVSFNATPGIMKYLAQRNVLAGDVGNPEAWFGFEFMDQAIRLITHTAPLPTTKEYDPVRLFTSSNFTSQTLGESQQAWYGSADFTSGYKKLWQK